MALAAGPDAAERQRDLLANALSLAEDVLGRAEKATVAFALETLGDIELPPATPAGAADQAQLRAAGALYLAAALEAALVLPAVETLAGLSIQGGLRVDLGPAADPLAAFWRGRNERLSRAEREAFFSRLFGTGGAAGVAPDALSAPNHEFEDRLIDLCEALYKLDETPLHAGWSGPARQTQVRTRALRLADNLLRHGGAMTAFAARDLLTAIRAALALLNRRELQAALGTRSSWQLVRTVARRYLGEDPEVALHVARGRAGLAVLAWLADALPLLDRSGGAPLVALDHPVVGAATEWLQASLSLTESAGTTAAPAW